MNNNVIMAVIAVIVVVLGFFIYTSMTDESEVGINSDTATTSRSATNAEVEAKLKIEAEQRAVREAEEAKAKEVAFTIDVANLPEAQQASLKTMGMNDTSIEITNAMLACARVDMSETRVIEIKDGASVTASEGIKLVSCYNSN